MDAVPIGRSSFRLEPHHPVRKQTPRTEQGRLCAGWLLLPCQDGMFSGVGCPKVRQTKGRNCVRTSDRLFGTAKPVTQRQVLWGGPAAVLPEDACGIVMDGGTSQALQPSVGPLIIFFFLGVGTAATVALLWFFSLVLLFPSRFPLGHLRVDGSSFLIWSAVAQCCPQF